MIYLITGVPGSGKTLYAVSTLMKTLASEVVADANGVVIKRRLVVDGIPDLTIDHAVMCESELGEKGKITCEGQGMANWHEWCQPGDVLVVDEVQRYLRPRALGVSPPECIKQLETHRHKGIDFVFITQRPGLIDQNIRQLVGRHQHVRRLFGMNRAVIYDWDGCQADTHRVAGATRTMWTYPRKAFALYKSSELHTKQRQKIPLWLALPVVAIVAGLFFAPQAYDAIRGRSSGSAVAAPAKPNAATSSSNPSQATSPSPAPGNPAPAPAGPPGGPSAQPVAFVMRMPDAKPEKPLQGCINMRGRCECFDEDLLRVKVPDGYCEPSSHRVGQMPGRTNAGGTSIAPGARPAAAQLPVATAPPSQSSYVGEARSDPADLRLYADMNRARYPDSAPSSFGARY